MSVKANCVLWQLTNRYNRAGMVHLTENKSINWPIFISSTSTHSELCVRETFSAVFITVGASPLM